MKRVLALALVVALVGFGVPVPAFAAEQGGQISGVAKSGGHAVANFTLHLRDTVTGQLATKAISNAQGAFIFNGLQQGSYIVELLDASGKMIATSSSVTLTKSAMVVSGVVVTAAAGTAAGQDAAAAGPGFWAANGPLVLLAAAAAGIGIAANKGSKSGSK